MLQPIDYTPGRLKGGREAEEVSTIWCVPIPFRSASTRVWHGIGNSWAPHLDTVIPRPAQKRIPPHRVPVHRIPEPLPAPHPPIRVRQSSPQLYSCTAVRSGCCGPSHFVRVLLQTPRRVLLRRQCQVPHLEAMDVQHRYWVGRLVDWSVGRSVGRLVSRCFWVF